MLRHIGAPEQNILVAQGNHRTHMQNLDALRALPLRRDTYSGLLRIRGEDIRSWEKPTTMQSPSSSWALRRSQDTLTQNIPVARRSLGKP